MKITLAVLLLVAAVPARGAGSNRIRNVKGHPVKIGIRQRSSPMFLVRNLKFYRARIQEDDSLCTVVTGELMSRYSSRDITVTLSIQTFTSAPSVFGGRLWGQGVGKVVVKRPRPSVYEPFAGLLPLSRGFSVSDVPLTSEDDTKRTYQHMMNISFEPFKQELSP